MECTVIYLFFLIAILVARQFHIDINCKQASHVSCTDSMSLSSLADMTVTIFTVDVSDKHTKPGINNLQLSHVLSFLL